MNALYRNSIRDWNSATNHNKVWETLNNIYILYILKSLLINTLISYLKAFLRELKTSFLFFLRVQNKQCKWSILEEFLRPKVFSARL